MNVAPRHKCFVQKALGGPIDSTWCSMSHLEALVSASTGDSDIVRGLDLYADDRITIAYSPFDSSNAKAKIVFVGLTPGAAQRRLALDEVVKALHEGDSLDVALRRAKGVAAFAGSMRVNLIAMLDGLGLPAALKIAGSSELFGDRRDLADSTSAICHSVFVRGANYSGTPQIEKHPVLAAAATQVLAANLAEAPDALVVPLGRSADSGVTMAGIDRRRVLAGFPHPSGANGSRVPQYKANRASMSRAIRDWFQP